MATPRTHGRMPSQRERPALPIVAFWWSGLETAPMLARTFAAHHADFAGAQFNLDETAVLADELQHMFRQRELIVRPCLLSSRRCG